MLLLLQSLKWAQSFYLAEQSSTPANMQVFLFMSAHNVEDQVEDEVSP